MQEKNMGHICPIGRSGVNKIQGDVSCSTFCSLKDIVICLMYMYSLYLYYRKKPL